MQFSSSRARLAAPLLVLALGAAACGGGSEDTPAADGASSSASGNATAVITVFGGEPENGLLPANTNETGGGKIMSQLFTGLVSYDAEGKIVNEVAESIETEDSKTFTVTLKDGWTFTNGEAITAKTFVDSWNFGALITNAQLNASFFEPIAGYAAVHPEDPTPDDEADPLPPPTAQTMSGLKVVDDSTFTVELEAASSTFPQRLGYTAFAPLPPQALADPETYGETPVGNGPYMLDGKWEHKVNFKTKVNPDYQGTKKPKNGGIDNKFYDTPEAGYADLQADQLDVIDTIPDGAIDVFETDLGDRAVNQPAGIIQALAFPLYVPTFSGPDANKVRQAISMAIDRDTITETIFNGTREPAKDYSSPVVEGYDDGICGEFCTYQPEKAKALLAEAGGLPGNTMTIGYNANGPHAAWTAATCNSIKNVLAIDCTAEPTPLFADFRAKINDRAMTSAFRAGWQMDYPALDNWLSPIYKTGGSANDGVYSNPAFDALLEEGDAATSTEEGIKKYQEAERLLVQDMPAIPLWNQNSIGGYSTLVDGVEFDIFSQPVWENITKS